MCTGHSFGKLDLSAQCACTEACTWGCASICVSDLSLSTIMYLRLFRLCIPLRVGGCRRLMWLTVASSLPLASDQWPGPSWASPVEMTATATVSCQTHWSGSPRSHDPGHVTQWGQPIVLLPLLLHAVGKHSNSWPRTVPETSATSASGENLPPAALEHNLIIIELVD